MSYDLYALPAGRADDAATADAYVAAGSARPTDPRAAELAARISARNPGDDRSFLSVFPLDADGDVVAVPAPFSQIQAARDVVLQEAVPAGFTVYDPQTDVLIDPRHILPGTIQSSTEGAYAVATAAAVTTLVHRLRDEDYLILEREPQVYAQTQRRGDRYVVEHRAGSPDAHYALDIGTAADVAEILRGWLEDNRVIIDNLPWHRLDLG